jgi:hypothetical protein
MGFGIENSYGQTNIIGEVDRSPSGNLILRIGTREEDGKWFQSGYVVLDADMERDFVGLIESSRTMHERAVAAREEQST